MLLSRNIHNSNRNRERLFLVLFLLCLGCHGDSAVSDKTGSLADLQITLHSFRVQDLLDLFSADLVLLCDVLARVLFAPFELPVGILLSLLGGPFLLGLLLRRKRSRIHE